MRPSQGSDWVALPVTTRAPRRADRYGVFFSDNQGGEMYIEIHKKGVIVGHGKWSNQDGVVCDAALGETEDETLGIYEEIENSIDDVIDRYCGGDVISWLQCVGAPLMGRAVCDGVEYDWELRL